MDEEGDAAGRYDLIALATHGRGGLQRWALGSVTDRVINSTKLPLMIVRPQQDVEK
jgi:nucleotide-binding universal stress UspA family protein